MVTNNLTAQHLRQLYIVAYQMEIKDISAPLMQKYTNYFGKKKFEG
jgi:hypothetical protein